MKQLIFALEKQLKNYLEIQWEMFLSPDGSAVFNTKQRCDNVVMTKTHLASQASGPSSAPDIVYTLGVYIVM